MSSASAQDTEAIGFFQAFMLPNVLNYAVAFGFFKLVSVLLSHAEIQTPLRRSIRYFLC